MGSSSLLALLVFLGLSFSQTVEGWWWPFSYDSTVSNSPPSEMGGENDEEIGDTGAKFEVTSVEEKFIQEGERYLKLSPLEKYQHSVSCVCA